MSCLSTILIEILYNKNIFVKLFNIIFSNKTYIKISKNYLNTKKSNFIKTISIKNWLLIKLIPIVFEKIYN